MSIVAKEQVTHEQRHLGGIIGALQFELRCQHHRLDELKRSGTWIVIADSKIRSRGRLMAARLFSIMCDD